ncbi:MAG: SlyX family protein [Planctomycetota bacterium]
MTERLEDVESLVTHLQRDVEQMHEVLVAQQAELAALRRKLEKAEARVDSLEADPEDRDPVAEKPPHY